MNLKMKQHEVGNGLYSVSIEKEDSVVTLAQNKVQKGRHN